MERQNETTLSIADRLERLSAQLDVLEAQIKADLSSSSDWYTQQFSELRAQTRSALMDIQALRPHGNSGSGSPHAEHDRHWLALKAAIQTYRDVVKNGNDNT